MIIKDKLKTLQDLKQLRYALLHFDFDSLDNFDLNLSMRTKHEELEDATGKALLELNEPSISAQVRDIPMTSQDRYSMISKNRKYILLICQAIELYSPCLGGEMQQLKLIDESTILLLESLIHQKWDTSRAVKLCYEINTAFANGSYISCLILARALAEHLSKVHLTINVGRTGKPKESELDLVISQMGDGQQKILDIYAKSFHSRANMEIHANPTRVEILPSQTEIAPLAYPLTILLNYVIENILIESN